MRNEKNKLKFDPTGRKIIVGKEIVSVVPESLYPQIDMACKDQGMVWEEIIDDCTLYVDQHDHCTLMYRVGKWAYSGTLLVTFSIDASKKHQVSFPKKWMHLELYLANNKY